ncbi:MAG: hypothetical protein Q8O19_04195 [Rectinemataceae bacterium]|nr:hypothetical protein [Rectinemataceae bacterium]
MHRVWNDNINTQVKFVSEVGVDEEVDDSVVRGVEVVEGVGEGDGVTTSAAKINKIVANEVVGMDVTAAWAKV